MVDTILYICATFSLVVTFIATLRLLWTKGEAPNRIGIPAAWVAVGCMGLGLLVNGLQLGSFPAATLKDSLLLLSFFLIATNAVVIAILRFDLLAAILTPCIILLNIMSLSFDRLVKAPSAESYLQSAFAVLHIPFFLLSYALFILAAGIGILYIALDYQMKNKSYLRLFNRFPPLMQMDHYTYRCISFGFLFLTLGIATGWLFAQQVRSMFSYMDAKVLSSVVLWLYYIVYLHLRTRIGWIGKRTGYVAITGCVLIIIAYVSGNFLGVSKFHGYQ
jgi:ABC-type uncharacterized transport system permease subunit